MATSRCIMINRVTMTGAKTYYVFFGLLIYVCKSESYFVTLSHNGPVVLGANITFKAELFSQYGTTPTGTFRFRWKDNALPPHYSESQGDQTVTYWNVSYPSPQYAPGQYEAEVIVDRRTVFFWPISSQRINFNITALLNGKMSLLQSGRARENKFVSSKDQVTHRVDLIEPDYDFLTQNATSILTYWFVDCVYYGVSPGYMFNFNYTQPGKTHVVEALLVASFEPPTTTTTTTTTTSTTTTTTPTPPTTVAPNATTGTTSKTTTTTTTPKPTTTSVPTTTAVSKNTSLQINSNEISNAMRMFPVQNSTVMPVLASAMNMSNVALNNNTFFMPYICLNTSTIPADPNKTYGYFHRKLVVKAPVTNVTITGTNWLKHGDMLDLKVSCNGSADMGYCIRFFTGSYNVTGNETCPTLITTDCQFSVIHYFREPSMYTLLIIIRNDVSKVVNKVGVNVYEVSRHAQLSVIVVPVTCSLIAVILIVFGVAYYVQSKNRYTIEVADFNFGQASDMEYKTFRERLHDSFSNAVNRSEFPDPGGSWSPSRKYGQMN